MNLVFCCEGESGRQGIEKRLSSLSVATPDMAAMSESDAVPVRIWYGPNPPDHTHVWLAASSDIKQVESAMANRHNLILCASFDIPAGASEQMHVVIERGQGPVYLLSQSEAEGYVAERLLSLQELI